MIDVSTVEARTHFYHSTRWIHVKEQAIARDHNECVWCKDEGKVTTRNKAVLEVDHIKELRYYPELALELSNLRTLCHDCHNKRHGRSALIKWNDEIFEF